MWMLLGLTAMTCALLGWRAQRRGFMIAYTLPFVWGTACLASWALGQLITGWISGIVYLGYSLLVIVIAGWEEPAPPVPVLPDEPEDADHA